MSYGIPLFHPTTDTPEFSRGAAGGLPGPRPAQTQEPAGSRGVWQTFTTANVGLRDNSVTALLKDRAGGLWLGTDGGGMSSYFEGAWQTFSVESGSLGHNIVTVLLEDRTG